MNSARTTSSPSGASWPPATRAAAVAGPTALGVGDAAPHDRHDDPLRSRRLQRRPRLEDRGLPGGRDRLPVHPPLDGVRWTLWTVVGASLGADIIALGAWPMRFVACALLIGPLVLFAGSQLRDI
jgi:hypothetical protein